MDRSYPANGEIFELTLDTGKKVTGTEIRRFKLVSVGYQPNLKAVLKALREHGEIPEDRWRKAFNAAYPKPDEKGPIEFADARWLVEVSK